MIIYTETELLLGRNVLLKCVISATIVFSGLYVCMRVCLCEHMCAVDKSGGDKAESPYSLYIVV